MPDAAEMNISIRIAEPGDAESACAALRRSILECCEVDHRHDDAILSAWLGNKNPQTVAAWFASPANFSLVATADSEMFGVGLLTRKGRIALCYVTPEARFTGAGKALLQGLEAQAVNWGLRTVHVNSTATAKDFYLRNGYVPGGAATSSFGTAATLLTKNLTANGAARRPTPRCSCNPQD